MSDFQSIQRIFKGQLSVSQLRYNQVIKLIRQTQVKTLIDLGTSRAQLLRSVQKQEIVEHMVGLDIDQEVFQRAIDGLVPFFIKKYQRTKDQLVQLYLGNILNKYPQLKNLNASLVTLVQVIQHIDQKDHNSLNQNVFGYLRPKYVFISTPNREFNVAFGWNQNRRFRHYDHRFEWTRKQFQNYVDKVCEKYNYKARISGVGQAVQQEFNNRGYCSQIAIFQKQEFSKIKQNKSSICYPSQQQNYSLPLTLKHQHTNYCWKSISLELLNNQIELILHICKPHKLLPWHKLLSDLKNTTIVQKLRQTDDIWKYDYQLKGYVNSFLKDKEWIKTLSQGIMRQEREGDRNQFEQEEARFRQLDYQREEVEWYMMSRSQHQLSLQSHSQPQLNQLAPNNNNNNELLKLRKNKRQRRRHSPYNSSKYSKSPNSPDSFRHESHNGNSDNSSILYNNLDDHLIQQNSIEY